MLTVVTWKWSCPGYRSIFTAAHVNALYRQVTKHLAMPHRFVCVTDDPKGVECETYPLWPSPLRREVSPSKPNCYRRLWLFSAEAVRAFGPRFVSMDLDTVVTGQLDPLFDRPEDVVMWGGLTHPTTPYNGSMFMLRAGTRRHVWDRFDPDTSPAEASQRRYCGSDQAIMALLLGHDEAMWDKTHGVYSYRIDLAANPGHLPADARIVFFHGKQKPWDDYVQAKSPWILQHVSYR